MGRHSLLQGFFPTHVSRTVGKLFIVWATGKPNKLVDALFSYSLVGNRLPSVWRWWWRFSSYVMSDSCNHVDCSPPGSSVNGILQVRLLKWVAISFSRGSSGPRNWTWVFCIAADSLPTELVCLPAIRGQSPDIWCRILLNSEANKYMQLFQLTFKKCKWNVRHEFYLQNGED